MKRALLSSIAAALPWASVCADTAIDAVSGRQAPPRVGAEAIAPTSSVRSLYVLHCAGCHGMNGAGSATARVPDMRRVGRFLQLDGGREFVISVPGVMGSGLDDRQVAEVTNWVLGVIAAGSSPAHQAPYEAAEVSSARATPLLDVAAARRRLVEQAQARGIEID